jgi:hypothetical protein
MAPSWSERQKQSGYLPDLGLGGTLVTVFVTSFFAAHVLYALFVIVKFGRHAFFVEGLRFVSWKHGILSNGQHLPPSSEVARGLFTFFLWITFIGCCEWVAGLMSAAVRRFPPLIPAVLRVIGGAMLVGFSRWSV